MAIYRLKGTSGPLLNQKFTLGDRLLIGRADDCHVRVDEADVAPRHAELLLQPGGGVLLRNLDPSLETLRNGVAVDEAALAGGDEIRIGTCRFMLQAPGLRPDRVLVGEAVARRAKRWPWLLVLALALVAAFAWQRGWLAI